MSARARAIAWVRLCASSLPKIFAICFLAVPRLMIKRWAALGALGALLNDCTIELERAEPTPTDQVSNASAETPASAMQAPGLSEAPRGTDAPE